MSMSNFQDETFQIEGFRHREQDRVIRGLEPFFEDAGPTPRIFSRIRKHFRKHAFADMMRTRACNEDAVGPE
jgi:hypothetical protein